MILIKLQGGLGNQMFQYAFASIIAKKNSSQILIDNSFFKLTEKKSGFTPRNFELDIFDNSYTNASILDIKSFNYLSPLNKIKKRIGLNWPKIYQESSFDFQDDVLSIKSPVYLKGYFQSYKYLAGFEGYIRNLFAFPIHKLSTQNKNLIPILNNQNTVSIHIRRGDYVSDLETSKFHGSCSYEYYLEAISLVTSKMENPTLVFFSDDADWVKENFKSLSCNKIFIDHNKGTNSWADMYLMSICSHNIIANSSFSWWGAWLNTNAGKIVIAPKKWFHTKEIDINSIIPEEWIII